MRLRVAATRGTLDTRWRRSGNQARAAPELVLSRCPPDFDIAEDFVDLRGRLVEARGLTQHGEFPGNSLVGGFLDVLPLFRMHLIYNSFACG
jgi:hypothetical protein